MVTIHRKQRPKRMGDFLQQRKPLMQGLLVAVVFAVLQFLVFQTLSSSNSTGESLLDKMLHPFDEYPFLDFDATSIDNHNASFAACLLTMEDDAIGLLQEWLAYHYTVLPLRRLIVANDPRSRTDPKHLVDKWQHRIRTTQWTDHDFLPVHVLNKAMNGKNVSEADKLTNLHRYRQRFFLMKCLRQLKYENHTMVALIDSDEFAKVPNRNWKHYERIQVQVGSTVQSDNKFESPSSKPKSFTVLDFLQRLKGYPPTTRPCIGMPRVLFGPSEDENEATPTSNLDHFYAKDFMTYRWQWHGKIENLLSKIPGKTIVNVSRIPYDVLDFTHIGDPHRPVRDYCKAEDVWILPVDSPLVVHHYIGRFDQWSFRSDPRKDRRTRQQFDELLAIHTTKDGSIAGWLEDFVNQVGIEEAMRLLEGVGKVEEVARGN